MSKTIQLRNGQRLFFTSDTHLGHAGICRATTTWKDADHITRDFFSLDNMNDVIINNINATVGENDILIHLGDFSFGGVENIVEFRSRIKCKNIILIYGNHDHHIENNSLIPGWYSDDDNIPQRGIKNTYGDDRDRLYDLYARDLFTEAYSYLELSVDIKKNTKHKKFILFHYPIASWKDLNKDVIHLFGHVHLGNEEKFCGGKSMDVGVEGNFFKPYELSEVLSLLEDRKIDRLSLPKDHHVKRVD